MRTETSTDRSDLFELSCTNLLLQQLFLIFLALLTFNFAVLSLLSFVIAPFRSWLVKCLAAAVGSTAVAMATFSRTRLCVLFGMRKRLSLLYATYALSFSLLWTTGTLEQVVGNFDILVFSLLPPYVSLLLPWLVKSFDSDRRLFTSRLLALGRRTAVAAAPFLFCNWLLQSAVRLRWGEWVFFSEISFFRRSLLVAAISCCCLLLVQVAVGFCEENLTNYFGEVALQAKVDSLDAISQLRFGKSSVFRLFAVKWLLLNFQSVDQLPELTSVLTAYLVGIVPRESQSVVAVKEEAPLPLPIQNIPEMLRIPNAAKQGALVGEKVKSHCGGEPRDSLLKREDLHANFLRPLIALCKRLLLVLQQSPSLGGERSFEFLLSMDAISQSK